MSFSMTQKLEGAQGSPGKHLDLYLTQNNIYIFLSGQFLDRAQRKASFFSDFTVALERAWILLLVSNQKFWYVLGILNDIADFNAFTWQGNNSPKGFCYCQTPSVEFENTESDNMTQYSFQSLQKANCFLIKTLPYKSPTLLKSSPILCVQTEQKVWIWSILKLYSCPSYSVLVYFLELRHREGNLWCLV